MFRAGAMLAIFVAFATHALSQDYPARQVTIIVPTAAGGPGDTFARMVGTYMSERAGATVVPDFRPGASGKIAMRAGAKAAPDGYTLTLANVGNLAINPNMFTDNGYDALDDYEHITFLTSVPAILVVRSDMPVNSAKELVDYIKNSKEPFNFGSSGNGSSPDLAAKIFRHLSGADFEVIPYNGSSPAVKDLVGGQVSAMFDTTTALPFIQEKTLKILAVAEPKRSALFPDVPTVGEALGSKDKDLDVRSWWVLLAPKGTPKEVVDKINTYANEAIRTPDALDRLKKLNTEGFGTSPEEARKFVEQQIAAWKAAFDAAGIKPE